MGCDIHLYVEYKRKESENFKSFGSKINPGRNYFMFGLLSKGVRSDNEDGFDAKGLPEFETMGYDARGDARTRIVDDPSDEADECTLDQALSWAENGRRKIYEYNGKPDYVDNPDWHSHSWLTSSEYSQIILKYNSHPEAFNYKQPEYEAVLAILNSFENNGFDSRVVFWFDN